MRLQVVGFLIVLLGPLNAMAVKPASEEEKNLIREQIIQANRIDSRIIAAQAQLSITRFHPNTPEYLQLQRNIDREKDKQLAAYTLAIHMTIRAYDLGPVDRRGTSVVGWTKDREITWLPIAREREDHEMENRSGGTKRVPQSRKDRSGETFADGVTYIYPETFRTASVGWLASVILHESTHFEQITTSGRGDEKTVAELEKEAYQTGKDNASAFFDESSDKEKKELNQLLGYYEDEKAAVVGGEIARKGFPGLFRRILPHASPPDLFDSRAHPSTELADLKKQSSEFEAQAIAVEQAMATKIKEQEKTARREHDKRLRQAVLDLSLRACVTPGSVTQSEISALPQPFDVEYYGEGPYPADLGACVLSVFLYLGQGGISAGEVARISMPLQEPLELTPSRPVTLSAPRPPLANLLWHFKDFAAAACASPDNVRIDPAVNKKYDCSNWKYDDMVINDLKPGMTVCQRQLFQGIIDAVRANQASIINRAWIRQQVAANTPSSGISPGSSPGGRDEHPGRNHDEARDRIRWPTLPR